ncbi:MAG: transposase [Agathobacter sp.]|nr:transposase [Agathobacter sp.]
MSYSPYSIEERFSMITDCLQSGLTINMWCREHDIPTGTFYSWISQVKKSGYQVDLPKRNKPVIPPNLRQEVVRVDLVKEETEIYDHPTIQSREAYISQDAKILTLKFSDCSLEIPAGTDMTLLSQVVRTMRCPL